MEKLLCRGWLHDIHMLANAMAHPKTRFASSTSKKTPSFFGLPQSVHPHGPRSAILTGDLLSIRMLEDPAYSEVVRWGDQGDSFVVLEVFFSPCFVTGLLASTPFSSCLVKP